jgi:hypothetical protein
MGAYLVKREAYLAGRKLELFANDEIRATKEERRFTNNDYE